MSWDSRKCRSVGTGLEPASNRKRADHSTTELPHIRVIIVGYFRSVIFDNVLAKYCNKFCGLGEFFF